MSSNQPTRKIATFRSEESGKIPARDSTSDLGTDEDEDVDDEGEEEEEEEDDEEEDDDEDEAEISHEEREQRHQAARMLENEEMLFRLSRQRNESVLQTRIYCIARCAGITEEMLKFDYEMDWSSAPKQSAKSSAAKDGTRAVPGSSKNNASSPASNRRDKGTDQVRGRKSTGSTR